jgi:hypothetical protein
MMENSNFNLAWTLLIIVFSSAIVAVGIRDTNRIYYRKHRTISDQEMRSFILALHGDVDPNRKAFEKRQEYMQAERTNEQEYRSFKSYLASLIP